MCVVWKSSRETDETATPCMAHLEADHEPAPCSESLRFARRTVHRPSASYGQCNPAVVEHRLRPIMTGRHSMSGKAKSNTGRYARYVVTDVTRPPQRPLPNGRDEALPRPCDGWPGWLRRRLNRQRHVAGRGGVSARGGRLRAADRVGRGPDQRAGGAQITKTGHHGKTCIRSLYAHVAATLKVQSPNLLILSGRDSGHSSVTYPANSCETFSRCGSHQTARHPPVQRTRATARPRPQFPQ